MAKVLYDHIIWPHPRWFYALSVEAILQSWKNEPNDQANIVRSRKLEKVQVLDHVVVGPLDKP